MIYFIVAGTNATAVKIGYTADDTPARRLNALQVGNHEPLSVLAFGPGSVRDEWKLHVFLNSDRIRGEWFRPTAQVLAAAARLGLAPTALVIEPVDVEYEAPQLIGSEITVRPKTRKRELSPIEQLTKEAKRERKARARVEWALAHPDEWAEFCNNPPKGRRFKGEHLQEIIDSVK